MRSTSHTSTATRMCLAGEPKAPEGEGWFLLGLWDTEDGPFAWYVRPKD